MTQSWTAWIEAWRWVTHGSEPLNSRFSARSQATGDPGCLPLSGRQSLPPGFLYQHGLAPLFDSSEAVAQDHAARLALCLRELADQIEAHPPMLAIAADSMAMDVQRSRLAPNPDALCPSGVLLTCGFDRGMRVVEKGWFYIGTVGLRGNRPFFFGGGGGGGGIPGWDMSMSGKVSMKLSHPLPSPSSLYHTYRHVAIQHNTQSHSFSNSSEP